MKRLVLILLALALPCGAQTVTGKTTVLAKSNILAGAANTVTGQWTWLQSTGAAGFASPGLITQACGTVTTTCTFKIPVATAAGSALAAGLEIVDSQNITISSAFTCVSSNPCLTGSGDKVDTFTLCASSACHNNNANDNVDAVYVAGGGGGATIITMNFSGSITTSTDVFLFFGEEAPPLCNGTPCTVSFDANQTSHAASGCGGGCTGNAMTLTARDGIIAFLDTASTVSGINAPYQVEQTGNMYGINATSAPAFTITTSGYYTTSAIAFKSSAGTFSAPSAPFTFTNGAPPPAAVFQNSVSCAPTCSISAPGTGTTVAGDLILIEAYGTQTISSITRAGETWTVPTGASTCQNTAVNDISCGYTLSSIGSATGFSVTMSGTCTCFFAVLEVTRSSGSFLLDAQNSGSSVGTGTLTGQTLTLSGTIDVAVCSFSWTTTTPQNVGAYRFPAPGGANAFGTFAATQSAAFMVLLNAPNNSPPKLFLSSNATTSSAGCIDFK